MTFEEFEISLSDAQPPDTLELALKALWKDAKGDWDGAHRYAQEQHDARGAWVHAYLHRKEGDLGNAGYWYARAKKDLPRTRLDDEWRRIAQALLTAA